MQLTAAQIDRLKDAFRELKAEQDDSLKGQGKKSFVHTQVYRQVRDERKCLLIGRKGSGKTAMLLGYRAENHREYLAEADIDIIADEFPLEALFNFFYIEVVKRINKNNTGSATTDLGKFLDPTRVAAYAWHQSLVASAVYMAANQILIDPEVNGRLSPAERRELTDAQNHISKLLGLKKDRLNSNNGGQVLSSMLVYFFGNLSEIIEEVVEEAGGSWAGMIAKVTLRLTGLIRAGTMVELRKPVQQIKFLLDRYNKKVLLTLDRFDDFYDEFSYRHENDEFRVEKREFLASLLKGLVIAARDLQREPAQYGWMHMIFTIPMDKFLELQLRERADLESNHVVRLEWSPAELFQMVNRRIAIALRLPDKEESQAWRKVFPFDVTNGTVKEVREDSFLYLIRHTLWNPREVQMFLKALFTTMEKKGMNEEIFRQVISEETENIVRREFIGQFIGEFHGLQKVLNKMGNVQLRTIMRYEDLCDKLSGLELFEECRTPDKIVLRLFHMGVLGIRASAQRDLHSRAVVTQQRQVVNYRYCFNTDENDPFSPNCEICFHPMFFEYLNIRHDEPYVVNQMHWEMFGIKMV
jgi:hypothetical protein